MDKVRIQALIEVLEGHKKHIEDGYADIGHIALGIETIDVLIHLLERSDNSDYAVKKQAPSPKCYACDCPAIWNNNCTSTKYKECGVR